MLVEMLQNVFPSPRRKQVILATILVYTLMSISIVTAYSSSKTYLQLTIKLTEGINVLILTAFVLLNLTLLWQTVTWLLFGELRLIEQEHIFERIPFTVINLIIVTSMFDDFQLANMLVLAAALIILKIYHWILADRLEPLLQRANATTRLGDIAFSPYILNLAIFGVVDFLIVRHFWSKYYVGTGIATHFFSRDEGGRRVFKWQNVLANLGAAPMQTPSSSHRRLMLLFGTEFCVVFLDLINLVMHTVLDVYEFYVVQTPHITHTRVDVGVDADTEGEELEEEEEDTPHSDGLEGKFLYEKIIDLVTRLAKAVVHTVMIFSLQFMILKDLIWDFLSIYQNAISLWKIYKNNKQLDAKLPNVTVHDLKDHENICIVCMDDLVRLGSSKTMNPREVKQDGSKTMLTQQDIDSMSKHRKPKKLPCGHMLHLSCLKNWMERSQTCPICRLAVFDEKGNVKPFVIQTNTPPEDTTRTAEVSGGNSSAEDSGEARPRPRRTSAYSHHRTSSSNNNDILINDGGLEERRRSLSSTYSAATTATTTATAISRMISETQSFPPGTNADSEESEPATPLTDASFKWYTFPIKLVNEDNKDGSTTIVSTAQEVTTPGNPEAGLTRRRVPGIDLRVEIRPRARDSLVVVPSSKIHEV